MINKRFWKNKRVLITGHTGFKGGWLSVWMKILGAKISGYSINPLTKKNFFEATKIKKIFIKDYRKDIKDYKKLDECIKKTKPEVIFHLAAQPQVLESFINPLNTIVTNVIGTTNLLEIVKKYKFIKSVVIITTDKVYQNNEKKIKFSETDNLGGDDLYSASKACADIISLSYFKSFFKNSECGIATARAGNCIGGGDWTKFRILTDATEAFLKNRELNIRSPNSTRPWQHVIEVIYGYILLAKKLNKNQKLHGQVFNFGPSYKKNYKVIEILKYLNLFWKKCKWKIKRTKSYQKESVLLKLNSNKANKILKWKTILSFKESLTYTLNWYKDFYSKKSKLITFEQIKSYKKKLKILQ